VIFHEHVGSVLIIVSEELMILSKCLKLLLLLLLLLRDAPSTSVDNNYTCYYPSIIKGRNKCYVI
jgi:hypothetical protein